MKKANDSMQLALAMRPMHEPADPTRGDGASGKRSLAGGARPLAIPVGKQVSVRGGGQAGAGISDHGITGHQRQPAHQPRNPTPGSQSHGTVGISPQPVGAQNLVAPVHAKMIAVMLPSLSHAFADRYFGELLSGICDRAAALEYKVMLEQATPQFIKTRKHIELFDRRFIDGVLCLGNSDHAFRPDRLRRQGSIR